MYIKIYLTGFSSLLAAAPSIKVLTITECVSHKCGVLSRPYSLLIITTNVNSGGHSVVVTRISNIWHYSLSYNFFLTLSVLGNWCIIYSLYTRQSILFDYERAAQQWKRPPRASRVVENPHHHPGFPECCTPPRVKLFDPMVGRSTLRWAFQTRGGSVEPSMGISNPNLVFPTHVRLFCLTQGHSTSCCVVWPHVGPSCLALGVSTLTSWSNFLNVRWGAQWGRMGERRWASHDGGQGNIM